MNQDSQPTDLPVSIERVGDASIRITWRDQTQTLWTAKELRDACPCATCREKRRAKDAEAAAQETDPGGNVTGMPMTLPVLSPQEAKPLRIEGMNPVGTYAYNVSFSDGHNSGIFTFALLKRMES